MVTRLIDNFKSSEITAMFISLTDGDSGMETSEVDVSSQMDAWLALRNLESNGERNRGLYVLKARGMAHSNQIREFVLTDHGVELVEVYVGPGGMLTGSARIAQNARERDETERRREELQRKNAELKNKRQQMEAEIERLRMAFKVEEQEIMGNLQSMQLRDRRIDLNRVEMGRARSGGGTMTAAGNGRARLPLTPA
jgi:circadian clock protein KaiC